MNKLIQLIPILSLIVLFLSLSMTLLLDIPPINNDEAIIADISLNLLHENRMGTDLWKGMLNGIENHAYWIPPVYFYANAAWFEIFGFSIQNQRLLPVILGSLFVLAFYRIFQFFLSKKSASLLLSLAISATFLLVMDNTFLKSARASRPEMMVLLLTMLGLSFYASTFAEKSLKKLTYKFAFTGFFLGFALITHLIAISFIFAVILSMFYFHKRTLLGFKGFYLFLIVLSIPVVGWVISIYPNYNFLQEQLSLVSASRGYSIPWFLTVSQSSSLWVRINYSLYVLISILFVSFTMSNRKGSYVFLSLVLIFTWTFATLGKIYWYTVYPVPFVYISLAILIETTFSLPLKKSFALNFKKFLWIVVCIVILGSNLATYFSQLNLHSRIESYYEIETEILKIVPPGKTLYLSSMPDLYFIFSQNTRNKLYEWPVLKTSTENYRKILDDTDFIIYNGILSAPELGNYLEKYVDENKQQTAEFPNSYGLQIIKLKDKKNRVPFK